MDAIDLSLSPAERLHIAADFSDHLFQTDSSVEAVVATGSTARGDSVPSSDVDMWCIVPTGAHASNIAGGVHRGVLLDMAPAHLEDLTAEGVLLDAYVLGYLFHARVLFDRTGRVTNLIHHIIAHAYDPTYVRARLQRLAEPVLRNLAEFRQSLARWNGPQLCRSSIFTLWCLADLIAEKGRVPPGGFRVLSRLKAHNRKAFVEITELQGSGALDMGRIKRLLAAYTQRVGGDAFGIDKVTWMADQDLKAEAFIGLWILLGLSIKEHPYAWLPAFCESWLTEIGWTMDAATRKLLDFEVAVTWHLSSEPPNIEMKIGTGR